MEEITINELLKRVIEGKKPKSVMVDGYIYKHNLINGIDDYTREDIEGEVYSLFDDYNLSGVLNLLNTKIKILDKPIIEELEIDDTAKRVLNSNEIVMVNKINEIIRVINNKE